MLSSIILHRGITPFMAFLIHKRPEKLAQGVKLRDATKEIAAMWNMLLIADRSDWIKKANELTMVRAEKISRGEIKTKRKKRKSFRRMSGYCLFNHENMKVLRRDNPSLSPTATIRKCATMWKNLAETEKLMYKKKAQNL